MQINITAFELLDLVDREFVVRPPWRSFGEFSSALIASSLVKTTPPTSLGTNETEAKFRARKQHRKAPSK